MTKEKFFDFVVALKENIKVFIDEMEIKDTPGKYKFSLNGDIADQNIHWGLGQTTFAARILYIFDKLDEKNSNSLAQYIETFLHSDGSYYDEYVANSTVFKRFLMSAKYLNLEYIKNDSNKRAETRQAIAALINLGSDYKEYKGINLKKLDINKFFNGFDWSKPWASGSHINHLIFFTKYSKILSQKEKSDIYKQIETNLFLISQKDGFYKLNAKKPSNDQLIGGMMKILMGLNSISLENKFIKESFVDFILDEMISCDACENFNTLYVLYLCDKNLDYRKSEIKKFVLNEIDNWMNYYHKKYYAFSFYKDKAQTNYYGARVSKGLDEPDLHGSAMFIWGILIASEILNLSEELGLQVPVM